MEWGTIRGVATGGGAHGLVPPFVEGGDAAPPSLIRRLKGFVDFSTGLAGALTAGTGGATGGAGGAGGAAGAAGIEGVRTTGGATGVATFAAARAFASA